MVLQNIPIEEEDRKYYLKEEVDAILSSMGFLPMKDPGAYGEGTVMLLDDFYKMIRLEESRGCTEETIRIALLNLIGVAEGELTDGAGGSFEVDSWTQLDDHNVL